MFCYMQHKSFLYFFRIKDQIVKLMNYNLITNVFSEMYEFGVSQGDDLLSVGFFHQSYHETLIRGEQDDVGILPRVPIFLIYKTETKSSMKFEIRDSKNPSEIVMEPVILDNISTEKQINLFLIERKFDLDMNCLQIDKHYLYYEYINDKLRTYEFDKKPKG